MSSDRDLINQLLTRAGMIMEDAHTAAIIDDGEATLLARIAAVRTAGNTVSALAVPRISLHVLIWAASKQIDHRLPVLCCQSATRNVLDVTDTDLRAKLSAAAKARAAKPEERERLVKHLQDLGQCPEVRARRSANATLQWADPQVRQERSVSYKARWADPDFKAQVLAKRRTTIAANKQLTADKAGGEQSG